MSMTEIKPKVGLEQVGIRNTGRQYWNLSPTCLIEESLRLGLGELADNGAKF